MSEEFKVEDLLMKPVTTTTTTTTKSDGKQLTITHTNGAKTTTQKGNVS